MGGEGRGGEGRGGIKSVKHMCSFNMLFYAYLFPPAR